MTILTLGVVWWAAVHLLPSVAPGLRERLIDAVGPGPYKAIFAIDIFLALILVIWGYRSADWIFVYDPPVWGVHANNLLMLVAIYLFGVGGARGWLATKIRHPQLAGVVTWAAAHLLANGDQASLILFGGMAVWAVINMVTINRTTGAWQPPEPAGVTAEIKLVVITLVIFSVIIFAHGWILGVRPIPG